MAHWFTADTHFQHESCIRMCSRPFNSVGDMDRTLIELWNARVGPRDTVWHLGDFSFKGDPQRDAAIFAALNGRSKFLIRGNHDKPHVLALPWSEPPRDLAEVSVEGTRLVLCHYGMRAWKGAFGGALQLHGHTHDLLPPSSQSCDVGVDSWAYAPVSLAEIKSRLAAVREEPEEIRLVRLKKGGGGPVDDES